MGEYEFIFVIDAPSAEVERALLNDLDAFVGGHGPVVLLTASSSAADPVAAARSLIADITARGGHVVRVYDDLVTRNQIASRAGVTPQAVGAWVRSERQHDEPFPQPYVLGLSELWRWAEVNQWLASVGKDHDDVEYPSAVDVARVNVMLNDHLVAGRAG